MINNSKKSFISYVKERAIHSKYSEAKRGDGNEENITTSSTVFNILVFCQQRCGDDISENIDDNAATDKPGRSV